MANTTKESGAPDSEKWYYMNGDQKVGPVDTDELLSLLASGQLPPDTRVWTKRLGAWSPADATDLVDRMKDYKAPEDKAEEVPAKKSKKRIWILVILAVATAAMVAAAIYLHFFRKEPEPVETVPVVQEEVYTYCLKDYLVYEDDHCAFWLDSVDEKGDYLELDVRCQNKTEDVISFFWDNIAINGNMFDPLWKIYVQPNSTAKSSVTFPRSALDGLNLMPADEIKFVLTVFNEDHFEKMIKESGECATYDNGMLSPHIYGSLRRFDGYDDHLFNWRVKREKDGRPYYVRKDRTKVYFDEIRNFQGIPIYKTDSEGISMKNYYEDLSGRPYYFSKRGRTIYYDGYGFAFHDAESGKNYYYDASGRPAYYGNNGVAEYYEGEVTQEMLDAGKPKNLAAADGSFLVHREFVIYPRGKDASEVEYPDRITSDVEMTYWDGDKGGFVVLGGQMDAFSGYYLHTYMENRSDNYIYLALEGVTVNGNVVNLGTVSTLKAHNGEYEEAMLNHAAALRPHSRYYRNIIIPADQLRALGISEVQEIRFRLLAVGENMAVPLYPIVWEAAEPEDVDKPAVTEQAPEPAE